MADEIDKLIKEVLDEYKISLEEAKHIDMNKATISTLVSMVNNRLENGLNKLKELLNG
jgi:hypothetical protein